MQDAIINWFSYFPRELATFFMAMMPVTELRVSIPIAIFKFNMHPAWAFLWSFLGNSLMGVLVILFVRPITFFVIKRSEFFKKMWEKYIHGIETKNAEKFNKWGPIALVSFIAIPLPMTGVFTGAVAASVFQVPFLKAAPLIMIGSAIAGIIVTIISLFF